MKPPGGDTNFSAQPKFATIRKLGGGIPHDDGRIDSSQKCLRRLRVFGDDGIAVVRSMRGDMRHGPGNAIHKASGADGIEIFGVPIIVGCGHDARVKRHHLGGAAHFAAGIGQRLDDFCRIPKAAVDQQRFGGAANAGPPHFGVHDQGCRFVRISRFVDIAVVDPVEMREHRNTGLCLDAGDQRLAATRDDDVDQAMGLQHGANGGPVLCGDKLDGVGGQPGRDEASLERGKDRTIAMDGFASPAQQRGIARCQAQSGGIGRHIGAAFIDDANHTQRHAHTRQAQAIGPFGRVDDGADRIVKLGHGGHALGHGLQPGRIKPQAINHRGRQAILGRCGDITGIGFQDGGAARAQCGGGRLQSLGLGGRRCLRQMRGRGTRTARHIRDQRGRGFGVSHGGGVAKGPEKRKTGDMRPRHCHNAVMAGEMDAIGDIATGALLARTVEPGVAGAPTAGDGNCLNCGAKLAGTYCSACGQKAQVHRTLGAFGHDLAHSVFHFDGKIWRTLPLLIWRPGDLTRRYVHGERAKFVSPFALFLFSVFLMVAIFSSMAPRFSDADRPLTAAQAASALDEDKAEIAALDALLQTAMAAHPDDDDQWVQAERQRNAALRRSLDAGPPARTAKAVAERRLKVQQRRADIEIARLAAARAAAVKAGQPTAQIDADMRNTRLGAQVLRGATQSFGADAVEADTVKLDLGYAPLNDIARHALENPQLTLYKIQSNAYKFSWALIPISVPFVWLLFFWRRDLAMFDHAVFVTYSIAFMMLLATVCVIGIQFATTAPLAGPILVLYPLVHMYRQLRGAYQIGRAGAVVRTALLAAFSGTALLLFALLIIALGLSG